MKTLENAVGKWAGILKHFGLDDQFLSKKHGPCPLCGGVDRYRWTDQNGSGSYFCSGCGRGWGSDLVMKLNGWDFKTAMCKIDEIIGGVVAQEIRQEKTDAEKRSYIKRILHQCKKVTEGDPVHKYLVSRCGVSEIPADIRYHPCLGHTSGGVHPVMVTIIRDSAGRGVTLHRTYLTQEGKKASLNPAKKFVEGMALKGAAARLCDVVDHVGIGEGIETSLSASTRFGIPVFAATNAYMLENWEPPKGIEKVTIFADNDSSFTGHAASYALAKRLRIGGYAVDVEIPPNVDTDWADYVGK
jgi:putative DNA primase/helicase